MTTMAEIIKVRIYANIPGPEATVLQVFLADGSRIPGDHRAVRDVEFIRALYGLSNAEKDRLAAECRAPRLPALDPIRIYGYEFRLEDIAGLRCKPAPAPRAPAKPSRDLGPTDDDIRSLEGNEDIESPYGHGGPAL